MPRLLVIDDNSDICILLKRYLGKNGYDVTVAQTGNDGLNTFKKSEFEIVLCDYRLPDKDGLEMIQALKAINNQVEIIIMTGYSDVRLAVQVMKKGAFEYVTKPIHPEEILHTIKAALQRKNLTNKSEKTDQKASKNKGNSDELSYVKGSGVLAKRLDKLIALVAPTDMTVVILGESGTGKEVTAKIIHNLSKRKKEKMIAVDCGAIPKDLAGSVLFGHVKGSFTGALTDKIGHFEAAHNGTLFLDEIGNLSYENQIKLLRVLQERKIQKIGDSKDQKINVRIIAATNENLKEKVEKGEFREDLYYRLNEFNLELPSLRNRKEDLAEIGAFLLRIAAQELDKKMDGFEPEVIKAFQAYDWPGNIREFKNVIKRATLLSPANKIELDAIPAEIQHPIVSSFSENDTDLPQDLKSITENAEKKAIVRVLQSTGFNKSKTAKILNVDRKTLYNKMKAYGIDLAD